ncbi:MAG: hypothetical protein LBO78_03700 [Rickettsiales bacterium]|jgi:hypothetical protein|nr:hypothetical protein [Rickettsiales bacterium]
MQRTENKAGRSQVPAVVQDKGAVRQVVEFLGLSKNAVFSHDKGAKSGFDWKEQLFLGDAYDELRKKSDNSIIGVKSKKGRESGRKIPFAAFIMKGNGNYALQASMMLEDGETIDDVPSYSTLLRAWIMDSEIRRRVVLLDAEIKRDIVSARKSPADRPEQPDIALRYGKDAAMPDRSVSKKAMDEAQRKLEKAKVYGKFKGLGIQLTKEYSTAKR